MSVRRNSETKTDSKNSDDDKTTKLNIAKDNNSKRQNRDNGKFTILDIKMKHNKIHGLGHLL